VGIDARPSQLPVARYSCRTGRVGRMELIDVDHLTIGRRERSKA
jgi:hypothetical protein